MAENLPGEFDIAVLGTGLPEAIVAGAAAKAGRRVLQLDSEDFYGSSWASLPLEDFIARAACYGQGDSVAYCRQDVLGSSRQYNIDLAPKMVFCSDPMIDCLLQARAQHYLEFKLLQGSYVWQQGALTAVPASRKDVFETRLSLADKRCLWRFLKSASEALQGQGPLKEAFDSRPLAQLLSAEGLTKPLREALLYAVAMADADQEAAASDRPESNGLAGEPAVYSSTGADLPDVQQAHVSKGHSDQQARNLPAADGAWASSGGGLTAAEGKMAFARYLASVSRYGRGTGAFLTPMYGSGELTQAFCRMAAVHGAVYALRHPVHALHVDAATKACTGIQLASGQIISCQAVVANMDMLRQARIVTASEPGQASSCAEAAVPSDSFAEQNDSAATSSGVCRAVCILDRSLRDGEQHFSIVVPPGAAGNSQAVRLLQLGPAIGVSPPDRYLLYASTPYGGVSAAATLQSTLQALICLSQQEQNLTSDAAAELTPGNKDDSEQQAAEVHSSSAASGTDTEKRPKALLAVYYHQKSNIEAPQNLPRNVHLMQPPDGSVGCASVVQHAREMFNDLLPGVDMLAGEAGALIGDESDDEAIETLDNALNRLQQGAENGQ